MAKGEGRTEFTEVDLTDDFCDYDEVGMDVTTMKATSFSFGYSCLWLLVLTMMNKKKGGEGEN